MLFRSLHCSDKRALKKFDRADSTKSKNSTEQRIKNAAKRPAPVWHGYAASVLCQTQWGVTDPEILSAIECHTTGKQNMSLLDKIIYMADMTSAERDYPGVEALRAEEMQNLDLALCHALEQSIAFVREKGNPLDPDTVAALDDARAACTR